MESILTSFQGYPRCSQCGGIIRHPRSQCGGIIQHTLKLIPFNPPGSADVALEEVGPGAMSA